MIKIKAQVDVVYPFTDRIMQLILKPESFITYQAGQYLKVHLENNEFCYSIANAPLGSLKYELHVRHHEDNVYNQLLLSQVKNHGVLTISLPFGVCTLAQLDAQKPILFIAQGTGFAPIHAMIEQLLAQNDGRNFELFWGAHSLSDLYLDDRVSQWQRHSAHFDYFSCLLEADKERLIQQVHLKHVHDLSEWQIVLSGPLEAVFNWRDALVGYGVAREHLYSDAFGFE